MHKNFNKKVYNRRSIVKTVFSLIKRKFGEIVKARKFYNQVKETKVKLLVYNINKKNCKLILAEIEDFDNRYLWISAGNGT